MKSLQTFKDTTIAALTATAQDENATAVKTPRNSNNPSAQFGSSIQALAALLAKEKN
jgi:hypothetical protein